MVYKLAHVSQTNIKDLQFANFGQRLCAGNDPTLLDHGECAETAANES